MIVEMLALVGTLGAAAIATLGIYVGKKLETNSATKVRMESLALQVLEGELERKRGELDAQNTKIDAQSKDIADLRVSNWLVLEHLLDVHRHFAEGNPPPPPPMPAQLLAHLREG
jgi:hypothetical protein